MWRTIMTAGGILSAVIALYLVTRIHRFSFIRALDRRFRGLGWLISLLCVGLMGLFALINVSTLLVVALHVFLAFVICDTAAWIVRRASKKTFGRDVQSAAALLLAALYLGVGWFMAHHVFITQYHFESDKALGEELRVVEIADSHLGITLDGEGFARQMERVNALSPDVVFIVGDFVDDDSDRADMIRACAALGKLQTKYGVYFVYGNHDDGYFHYRNFSSRELREELSKNGVTILEDESVLVDGRFYVTGRRDRSMPGRKAAQALTEGLNKTKYIILLDHQPNDYANEALSGADLVLSGHTHGGHIFPAGQIGLMMGANDSRYGVQRRNGTTFVVTSGISGWAIPFKTGTFSEIVVIDIKGK